MTGFQQVFRDVETSHNFVATETEEVANAIYTLRLAGDEWTNLTHDLIDTGDKAAFLEAGFELTQKLGKAFSIVHMNASY